MKLWEKVALGVALALALVLIQQKLKRKRIVTGDVEGVEIGTTTTWELH